MKRKKQFRKKTSSRQKSARTKRRPLRTKPPIIKKSTKLPTRQKLNPGEVMEFRSAFGNKVKKLDSRRRYFAFIKNTKSKKIVATFNHYGKRSKELVPRKFATSYRKYISTPIVRPKIPRKPKSILEFKLVSHKTIVSQIHKVARPAALQVYNEAKREGFCVFRLKVHGPLGTPMSRTLNIRKGERLFDIEAKIAYAIIDTLRAGFMRMSNLELTDRPRATMARSVLVELEILDVSGMG